jgi:hypothetical protein
LKVRPDPRAFEQADKVLSGLRQLDQKDKMDLFYFDESGVSLTPVVPDAWQPSQQTLELPAFSRQRVNLLGFMNRDNAVFHTVGEGAVDGTTVVAAIEAFIAWRDSETLAVLVLDNASIHTSAEVLEQRDAWLGHGLILFCLPVYLPELNLIEIFWRKFKLRYGWLPSAPTSGSRL